MPSTAQISMSAGEFAKYAGVAASTVTNWLDRGMPAARGKRASGAEVSIDLQRAVRWLAKVRGETPAYQRIQLAKAEQLEMANLKARGEVILVESAKEQVLRAIAFLNQDLTAVAQRATSDETIQARIRDEIISARNRFADHLAGLAKAE